MTSIADIVQDAAWLPLRFDPATRTIHFVHLPRAAHAALTFLSSEYLADQQTATVPAGALAQQQWTRAPLHMLFHSAFCCSTLLVRACDVPGQMFGINEPQILNDLALAAHTGRLDPAILDLVLGLLSRPWGDGEAVIVKPSNEANLLIPRMMEALPDARAVLLSSSLDDFLFSIAKKGMWGRIWGRRIFALLKPHARRDPGFDGVSLFQQTDLQIAALAWLLQRAQFEDSLAAFPGRIATLTDRALLARKADCVDALARHVDRPLPAGAAQAIAASPVFAAHAKEQGRAFDDEAKHAERAGVAQAHGEEIAMVVRWADAVAAHMQLSTALAAPLVEG